MANQLIHETSPYLLQHAHNPVDWRSWSADALEQAKVQDKPILLSIGYSACHWCHVMEHESFENESIARMMNENFISIKVDREERPDLDQIYMNAVQIMTGSGGWPLTVFLLPTGEPFYGGTYFPPEDRYGRPGFPRLLAGIAEAWRARRSDISENAQRLVEQLNRQTNAGAAVKNIDRDLLDRAAGALTSQFDSQNGGFGGAPKFPPSMSLDFLMRYHHRTGDENALRIVNLTLEKMACGGMYDQVGGGFHRYSTDQRWLVPHFEKMLYDNALLARAYLDAWRLTGRPLYRQITEETLDYVARELRAPGGGFYSTEDADSEGVEGKFYVWDDEEFRRVAGGDADLLARYFDVTPQGNWEGRSILNVPRPPELFCRLEGISEAELQAKVREVRRGLVDARQSRIRPARDEKILTDWNGLMLRAFADAAAFMDRSDYRDIAVAGADFILNNLWDGKRLLHGFKDGRARFNAYLDDYSNFADGLLALYQLTFDDKWLRYAALMADHMVDRFWDSNAGGFYFTGSDHENLVSRTKDHFDNATPSGNSVAADVFARLGALLERSDYRDKASVILESTSGLAIQFPTGFGRFLAAADFHVGPSREIAIAGGAEPFVSAFRKHYLPRAVIAAGETTGSPLLRGRTMIDGKTTAYVCENFTCKLPVTDVSEFEKQLLDSSTRK